MSRGAAVLEHMLVLRSLPAFSGLDDEVLAQVARRAREVVLPAGEVLLRQGQPVHRTWVVAEGRVRVEGRGRSVMRTEGRLGVGTLDLLADAPSDQTVTTEARSRLLVLEREALLDVMEEDFSVLAHVLRVLSARILTVFAQLDRDWRAPERPRPVPSVLLPGRPLNLVERVLAVRQVPAFGRSSLDSVARYARLLEERRVPAGATLWAEDEPCSTYVHLVQGTVSGTRRAGAGRLHLGPPSMPGLFGVLSGRESRWYTAEAETDLVLLRVDRELLLDLLEDDFEMASFCLKLSARRLLRFLALRDEPATTQG